MLFGYAGQNPNTFFFSKVFKFTWKRAESKEKENFSFFRFLFFELWSFFSNFGDVITTIFYDFFTITQKIKIRRKKIYYLFHSIQQTPNRPWKPDHKCKTEGRAGGGRHILSWKNSQSLLAAIVCLFFIATKIHRGS